MRFIRRCARSILTGSRFGNCPSNRPDRLAECDLRPGRQTGRHGAGSYGIRQYVAGRLCRLRRGTAVRTEFHPDALQEIKQRRGLIRSSPQTVEKAVIPQAAKTRRSYAPSHKEVIVGAIIDRPQTTAKPKRATNGRPYKQISAEILFSLPICVIMGLHRRAGACSRRNERLESKKAAGVNPRPTIKGYGLCPKHLYYKCETGDKTER